MAKISLEISIDQIVEIINQLPEKEQLRIRESIKVKKDWAKRLYNLYTPAREEAKKYPEKEVDEDISEAIRAVRNNK